MSNSYLPPVVDIVRTGDAVRAETARTGAETARTGAETARTGAETARTGAETARTGAETARTAAETARDNAQAASASAAASYDAFDDRYLGAKASDPTLDNDGAALITGALYWSTTLNNLRFWSGTVWVPTNSTFTQAVADTRYLQLTGGTLTGGLNGTTGTFTGAVSGTTGTFTGAVSGTTGTFTGAVSGTTGTFTGVVSGAAASADGHLLNRVTADGRYPPPGSIFWFAANAAPSGYLKANGALVSRSTYSALFAAIGTTFGVGDGSTTFALPDLRGEFVRGWDDGRGIDSGRAFGSAQAADFASHTHSTGEVGTGLNGSIATTGSTIGVVGDGANVTGSTGGTETRPRNIALLAIIKF